MSDRLAPTEVPNSLAKTPKEWIELAKQQYTESIASAGAALLQTTTPAEIAEIQDFFIRAKKGAEKFVENSKKRLLQEVLRQGKKITKKGSIGLIVSHKPNGDPDRGVIAKVKSTKLQADKVEKLLRSKNLDPDVHMDVEKSWSVNEMKLEAAITKELLTRQEVEACRLAFDPNHPSDYYTLGESKELGPEGFKKSEDND